MADNRGLHNTKTAYFEKYQGKELRDEDKENYLNDHLENKKMLRHFYYAVNKGLLNDSSCMARLFGSSDKHLAHLHAMQLIDPELFSEEIRNTLHIK